MTPSEYLLTNPTAEEHSYNYLLMPAELRDSMLAKQDTLTTNNHINPVVLIDGRYGSCCDIYNEVGVGGIYHQIWEMLDKAKLDLCEVVDKAAFLALLPQPDPDLEI